MLMRSICGGLALVLMCLSGVSAKDKAPWPSEVFNAPERRHVPGQFDYYVLALSWSPTHCMTASPGRDDTQCARRNGRRFGFILHGLWPQYERGYPTRCRTQWKPFVPEPVIAAMRDVTPSRGLVIHEYREHGTCSGLKPGSYFALARNFFGRVKIPKQFQNPFEMQFASQREVEQAFMQANPGLKPDMFAVTCSDYGNRLKEVRICMTRDGRFRTCSPSGFPRKTCRDRKLHVPPVRSTWRGGSDPTPTGRSADRLPAPRVIESPRRF